MQIGAGLLRLFSHAAQGRTVDTAILYLDAPTDTAGIYVPLTRGRDANHAYITASDHGTARDLLERADRVIAAALALSLIHI